MTTTTEQAPAQELSLAADMPVRALAAHPGNVRRDLAVTTEFTDNIRRFGVRVPLTVVPDGEGYRIVDGHRRLNGAIGAGRDTVPCLIDRQLAGDDAQQYLDMVTTARHRQALTPVEEAAALFAAHRAGANKTALAVAIGSREGAAQALKVAALTAEQQAAAEAAGYEFSLEQLANLTDFAGDPEVFARLITAARDDDFDRQYQIAVIDRRDAAARAKLAAGYEAAGVTLLAHVPRDAHRIAALSDEHGTPLTEQTHRGCTGHAVLITAGSPPEAVFYCTDPVSAGHVAAQPARSESEQDSAARARVTLGNREWRAAQELRLKWLRAYIGRPAVSAAQGEMINRFTTSVFIKFPETLHNAHQAKVKDLLAALVGAEREAGEALGKLAYACDKRRLPLFALAAVAAPVEVYACQIKTWRTDTDAYDRRWRPYAAEWLSILSSFGYPLTPIEQAVADGAQYTPVDPKAAQKADEEPAQPADGEHEEPADGGVSPADA